VKHWIVVVQHWIVAVQEAGNGLHGL
jgi:hypothetical protein